MNNLRVEHEKALVWASLVESLHFLTSQLKIKHLKKQRKCRVHRTCHEEFPVRRPNREILQIRLTSKFDLMRSGVTLLTMTIMPLWSPWRRSTWAGVLLCLWAISITLSSSNSSFPLPLQRAQKVSQLRFQMTNELTTSTYADILHETRRSKRCIPLNKNIFWEAKFNQLRVGPVNIDFNLVYCWWNRTWFQNAFYLPFIEVRDTNRFNKPGRNQFFHGLFTSTRTHFPNIPSRYPQVCNFQRRMSLDHAHRNQHLPCN